MTPTHPIRPRGLRRAVVRLATATSGGLLTALGFMWAGRTDMAAVAGWDVGALVLCALAWFHIWHSDAAATRQGAAADDPGRTFAWLIVLAASTFSLFSALVFLRTARHVAPVERTVIVGLCLAAVALAWIATHTAYALRYAHLYYRDDGEGEGGLAFPGGACPTYFDFAYFAFTVGMCFQVSDVTVPSTQIRRMVLSQALLSFVYNTTILALAINLVIGLFS